MSSKDVTETSYKFGWIRRKLVDPDIRLRVEQLELESEEARGLSLRVAELTDLVAELVVPLAQIDPERAARLLEQYRGSLGS